MRKMSLRSLGRQLGGFYSVAWLGPQPGRGLWVDSPDRFATDLSHDGALSPQILEAQGQETVDNKCCRGTGDDSEGQSQSPSTCRRHQIHSAYPRRGSELTQTVSPRHRGCRLRNPGSRSQLRQGTLGMMAGEVCAGRCACVKLRVPAELPQAQPGVSPS